MDRPCSPVACINQFGLKSIAEQKLSELVSAVRHHSDVRRFFTGTVYKIRFFTPGQCLSLAFPRPFFSEAVPFACVSIAFRLRFHGLSLAFP